jgi:ribosomal protein S17E|tara:strand:- start:132 stop:380 length:249 start_codon:yes stop_codon:yes gene_type:complete
LKVLAIIFLTYFFFKYTIRLLAPFLIKRFANKMQDKFRQEFNQQYKNNDSKEGEVTIENKKKSSNSKTDKVGDYVDFEEVDE